jgi:hypothetical protein
LKRLALALLALVFAFAVFPHERVTHAGIGGGIKAPLVNITPASLPGLFLWMRGDKGIVLTPSAVVATGTTPPAVTLTGTPSQSTAWSAATTSIEIDITTLGARGTALFTWKLNGVTQQTGQTTAATFLLGSTGITANFPTGTYAANNVYTSQAVLSSWTDLSANAVVFTPATVAFAWNASDATFGGQASVTGISTNSMLAGATTTQIQPLSVYVVFMLSAVNAQQNFVWTSPTEINILNTGYAPYAGSYSPVGTPDTGAHAWLSVLNGAGASQVWVDSSTTALSTALSIGSSGWGAPLRLGNTSAGFAGNVAEIFAFSGVQTSGQRALMFRYIHARYGLTVADNDNATDWRLALLDLPRAPVNDVLVGWPYALASGLH